MAARFDHAANSISSRIGSESLSAMGRMTSMSIPTSANVSQDSKPGGRNDEAVEVRARHVTVGGRITELVHFPVCRRDPVAATVRCGEDGSGGIEAAEGACRIAVVRGVAVVVDSAVGREDPIATAVRRSDRRGHRGPGVPRCPVIGGVAEGVDVPGLGDEPVAVAAGVRHHCDGCARTASNTWARTGEMGVTECEHATVGRHHEVATIVVGGHHANDGGIEAVGQARASGVEAQPRNGAVELGVAKAENAAIGCVEPVAAVVFGRHNADDGALELEAPGRAVELGRAEAEDPAVRANEPVAVCSARVAVAVAVAVVVVHSHVRLVVPDDAEKLRSPEYVAVIVSLPAGALLALQLADPDAMAGVVQRAVEPAANLTVPVGLPDPEVTVAEYVTDEPAEVDVGLTLADVVDWNVVGSAALPTEPV